MKHGYIVCDNQPSTIKFFALLNYDGFSRILDSYLGQKTLDEINSELIEFIAQKKERTNVTPTTVNRMLEIIRAILNKAHKEWQWINTMP